MDINNRISERLKLNKEKVDSAINLLDDGNSVPFIARYRKEVTGSLTDENLRDIEELLSSYRNLEDRKKTIYKSLEDQNVSDPELLKKIDECEVMSTLEDLYRPYKPKRVTRASKAIKAGLKPLAEYALTDRTGKIEEEATKYICEDYPSVSKVIQGAMDILAEQISDNPNYRTYIKDLAFKQGIIHSEKLKDAPSDVFDNYQDYNKSVSSIKSYNVLAINRGVQKKCLTAKLVLDDDTIINHIKMFEIPNKSKYYDLLSDMIIDSYNRLIYPSVSNDVFATLFDKASDESIIEFKRSLEATLMYPPLKNKRVLGFDPGFTHGCKLAFIDEYGKVLDTYVLKDPYHSTFLYQQAKDILKKLLIKNQTYTIALGNGTASRESEKLLNEMKDEIAELKSLDIVIVSESGASIYSATKLAQEEFPDYEPNLRSAVSIARRLEDPLSELVKIPPTSIGVGQYQYDIDAKKLSTALDGVVTDCVNEVGVNLNTASSSLLSYVSGINSKIANNIVKYREEHTRFKDRKELLKVTGLGPKAFLNCAGFLKILDGDEILDSTSVHPESYTIAKKLLAIINLQDEGQRKEKLKSLTDIEIERFAKSLEVGIPTLKDIIAELIQPSRDPREKIVTAKLNSEITDIKQLKVGQILEGTIRNVTGFGFFVDLGIEINGLVHISEMADHFVRDPHTIGKPGDIVKVKVKEVELKRNRISLTMKGIKQ